MDECKRLIARRLPLPPEEIDNIMQYIKDNLKSSDQLAEYLEQLLGNDSLSDILKVVASWNKAASKSNKVSLHARKQPPPANQTSTKKVSSMKGKDLICDCMAQEHGLWTNCQHCGKILCKREQELSKTNCTFCKQPLVQGEESVKQSQSLSKSSKSFKKLDVFNRNVNIREVLDEETKEKQRRFVSDSSTDDNVDSGLEKAMGTLERLLKFDQEDTARTKVHDIADDYHSAQSNIWLSPAERALLRKKELERQKLEEEERRRFRIDIDVASSKISSSAPVHIPKFSSDDILNEESRKVPKAKPITTDYIDPTVYVHEGNIQYIPSRKVLDKSNWIPLEIDEVESHPVISYDEDQDATI